MVHSAPFTRLVWYTYLREGDMSSVVAKGGGGRFTGVVCFSFFSFCVKTLSGSVVVARGVGIAAPLYVPAWALRAPA